jgi:hypothetical protein
MATAIEEVYNIAEPKIEYISANSNNSRGLNKSDIGDFEDYNDYLEKVQFPEGQSVLGYRAFYHCSETSRT